MFIHLTTKDNPIYVNTNHIVAYRTASKTEKELYGYNTVLVIHGLEHVELDVLEHVEEINKLIKPYNIPKDYPISEVKLPLDTPLKDLHFSKRAENILAKQGVETLGDIDKALNPKLNKFIRGLGSVTYTEIIQKYHACGYEFSWMPHSQQSAENGAD